MAPEQMQPHVPAIVRLLYNEDTSVTSYACTILGTVLKTTLTADSLPEGLSDQFAKFIGPLLQDNRKWSNRKIESALQLLSRVDKDLLRPLAPLVVALLRDHDKGTLIRGALKVCSQFDRAEILRYADEIMEKVEHNSAYVRAAAVLAIGSLVNVHPVPYCDQVLKRLDVEQSDVVRKAILRVIGTFEQATILQVDGVESRLREWMLAEDVHADVRLAAVKAIGRLSADRLYECYRPRLSIIIGPSNNETDRRVEWAAIEALNKCGFFCDAECTPTKAKKHQHLVRIARFLRTPASTPSPFVSPLFSGSHAWPPCRLVRSFATRATRPFTRSAPV